MYQSPPDEQIGVTIGQINDAPSMHNVCATLAALHGDSYTFTVTRWHGPTELTAARGRHRVCFVMQADNAHLHLTPGQRVRGVPPTGPFQRTEEHWAQVTAATVAEIWPGDVLCVAEDQPLAVSGHVTCFEVTTEATTYPLPAIAFLRHLEDRPGGCAAYPGAFRREALPPRRAAPGDVDQRGANRVNEHTLDMRFDRKPQPQPHHHGPVAIGEGHVVNHSETALVLPRARYNLPPVGEGEHASETGSVILYHDPTTNPAGREIVTVYPGTVIVTPAATLAEGGIAGHCFENAFAMLVAIPGFVSPHHAIDHHTGDNHTSDNHASRNTTHG